MENDKRIQKLKTQVNGLKELVESLKNQLKIQLHNSTEVDELIETALMQKNLWRFGAFAVAIGWAVTILVTVISCMGNGG